MKILIAIAPEKFRDEELAGPADALTEAGIGFEIASTHRGTCMGMLGAKVTAALSFEEVDPTPYHGIVIVGGVGSPVYLWNEPILIGLAKYFFGTGKLVAAICLSPVVLAHAGMLRGKQATYYDTPASRMEMKKGGAILVERPVVTDGLVITANGPPASREFGAAIVHTLTTFPW
jgi:protease I